MPDKTTITDPDHPSLVAEEAYERAERQALALLDEGFHLGGVIPVTRDEWHER